MKRKWFRSTLHSFNFSSLYQVDTSMFQKSDLEKFNLKLWHSTCSGERFWSWKLRVADDALGNAADLWLWAQSVEIERLFRLSILKKIGWFIARNSGFETGTKLVTFPQSLTEMERMNAARRNERYFPCGVFKLLCNLQITWHLFYILFYLKKTHRKEI